MLHVATRSYTCYTRPPDQARPSAAAHCIARWRLRMRASASCRQAATARGRPCGRGAALRAAWQLVPQEAAGATWESDKWECAKWDCDKWECTTWRPGRWCLRRLAPKTSHPSRPPRPRRSRLFLSTSRPAPPSQIMYPPLMRAQCRFGKCSERIHECTRTLAAACLCSNLHTCAGKAHARPCHWRQGKARLTQGYG